MRIFKVLMVLFFVLSCGTEKKTEDKKDSDGDGVLDKYDQCPTTPGTVPNNGCPEVSPPPTTGVEEVFVFDFDETSGSTTEESKSNINLSINKGFADVFRTEGVSGKALRPMGYFGWASGTINKQLNHKSISVTGWLAPSLYPVQRKDQDEILDHTMGAIFTNRSNITQNGIAFGINQHGRLIAHFSVDGVDVELLSSETVPIYEWSHIALVIDAENGKAEIFKNGTLLTSNTFSAGRLDFDQNQTIYIGKGSQNKTFAGFVTNGLNAAIDEVKVWDGALTSSEITSESIANTPSSPDLSVDVVSLYADDYLRPKYHVLPTFGWTNEPHGLFYLDGVYHIFNQKNGNGPYWSHKNWGHFISEDLVNWEEKRSALWPRAGQFDEVGIWSGHAIVENNQPYIFYTGVNKAKAAIGLAKPKSEDFIHWEVPNGNPIISGSPGAIPNADFRDPFVFKHNNDWYMMIGTGIRRGGEPEKGGLFLYKSTSSDFKSWNFVGIMKEGNPNIDQTGAYWEMPFYYDFGSKAILGINRYPNTVAQYWTGSFSGSVFNADQSTPHDLDVIGGMLAPAIALDKDDNLIAIGILPDEVSSGRHKIQGWANIFSLPRVWTISGDKILQNPHPQLNNLRSNTQTFDNITVSTGMENNLTNATARQAEVEATVSKGTASRVGFHLFKGALYKTVLYYDYNSNRIGIERSNSTSFSDVPKSNESAALVLPDQNIKWRIFIDGSVVEVFIEEKHAFSFRVFPLETDLGLDVFASGGTATFDMKIHAINTGGTISSSAVPTSVQREYLIPPTVFPNPSSGAVKIVFPTSKQPKHFYGFIFNTSGEVVSQFVIPVTSDNQTHVWDGYLSNGQKAPSGVYILKTGENFNSITTTKIIIK